MLHFDSQRFDRPTLLNESQKMLLALLQITIPNAVKMPRNAHNNRFFNAPTQAPVVRQAL